MESEKTLQKLGCAKNCSKPCYRSEDPRQKQKFKQQHRHPQFKLYSKLMKKIESLDLTNKNEQILIQKQLQKNFDHFRKLINLTQQKLLSIISQPPTPHPTKPLTHKISLLKQQRIDTLTCKDIYEINTYLASQVEQETSFAQESEKSEKRRKEFQIRAIEEIELLKGGLKYEGFDKEEIRRVLVEADLEKVLPRDINDGTERERSPLQKLRALGKELDESQSSLDRSYSLEKSLSETVLKANHSQQSRNISKRGNPQYSHLTYLTSQASQMTKLQKQRSHVNSPEVSMDKHSLIGQESFRKGISQNERNYNNNTNETLHLTVIEQENNKKMNFSKSKLRPKNADDFDSDHEDIEDLFKGMGDESRFLEPNEMEEIMEEQNESKSFGPQRYLEFVRNDMTEQQQMEYALKLSQKLQKDTKNTSNEFKYVTEASSDFHQNDRKGDKESKKSGSSGEKREKYSEKSSKSIKTQESLLMTIREIHKLTDKIYSLKEKFDVQVCVISIIEIMNTNNSQGSRYKMKFFGADQTGCSIFYIDFNRQVKPGAQLRLYNCTLASFSQPTNYQIQTLCRNITLLQKKPILCPNFQIMLSRLNHIKGRWNYDVRNNKHYKVSQIGMLYRRQGTRQVLLKKHMIITVIKRLSRNQFIVGDYTGRIRLSVEERFMEKKNFGVEEGDVLNVLRGMVTKNSTTYEEDDFLVNTNHEKCVIFNLRNHQIKFYQEEIPEN